VPFYRLRSSVFPHHAFCRSWCNRSMPPFLARKAFLASHRAFQQHSNQFQHGKVLNSTLLLSRHRFAPFGVPSAPGLLVIPPLSFRSTSRKRFHPEGYGLGTFHTMLLRPLRFHCVPNTAVHLAAYTSIGTNLHGVPNKMLGQPFSRPNTHAACLLFRARGHSGHRVAF